jgi:hypothetical protein
MISVARLIIIGRNSLSGWAVVRQAFLPELMEKTSGILQGTSFLVAWILTCLQLQNTPAYISIFFETEIFPGPMLITNPF